MVIMTYSRVHVHRPHPKSSLAACHPPARILPSGRKIQKAHSRQSFQAAQACRRCPRRPPQGYNPNSLFGCHRSLVASRAYRSCSRQPCGIDRIIAPRRSPQRDLVAGMIAARILEPSSKLVRRFAPKTATSTLADELRLPAEEIDENLLYEAMDWLVERQEAIERRLAGKHLEEGALVLMTSAWSYSRCCPLVRHGYSRDGKKGVPQIECCAIAPDGRSRSRPSRAILQTRPRWLRRSASCAGVSSGLSWSVTAACCSYPRRRQACGARLDQRPARARGPCSGRQRRAATLPFRRAGRDHVRRTLPRRAARGLPQPLAGERAGA